MLPRPPLSWLYVAVQLNRLSRLIQYRISGFLSGTLVTDLRLFSFLLPEELHNVRRSILLDDHVARFSGHSIYEILSLVPKAG
jgi:hypothetical protein